MIYNITKTKQSPTKLCAVFMEYIAHQHIDHWQAQMFMAAGIPFINRYWYQGMYK